MNEQATEWSHLPNAAHIDWIIQDVELNLIDWVAAWWAARDAAYLAAREAAWFAARDAAYLAARDAIQALVAYDHAGALFDIPVEQVRDMADLGQPAAILMLPACEVRAMRDNG